MGDLTNESFMEHMGKYLCPVDPLNNKRKARTAAFTLRDACLKDKLSASQDSVIEFNKDYSIHLGLLEHTHDPERSLHLHGYIKSNAGGARLSTLESKLKDWLRSVEIPVNALKYVKFVIDLEAWSLYIKKEYERAYNAHTSDRIADSAKGRGNNLINQYLYGGFALKPTFEKFLQFVKATESPETYMSALKQDKAFKRECTFYQSVIKFSNDKIPEAPLGLTIINYSFQKYYYMLVDNMQYFKANGYCEALNFVQNDKADLIYYLAAYMCLAASVERVLNDNLPSPFFFGPPHCGKTYLPAHIVGLRSVARDAEGVGRWTLSDYERGWFVDELHQDTLHSTANDIQFKLLSLGQTATVKTSGATQDVRGWLICASNQPPLWLHNLSDEKKDRKASSEAAFRRRFMNVYLGFKLDKAITSEFEWDSATYSLYFAIMARKFSSRIKNDFLRNMIENKYDKPLPDPDKMTNSVAKESFQQAYDLINELPEFDFCPDLNMERIAQNYVQHDSKEWFHDDQVVFWDDETMGPVDIFSNVSINPLKRKRTRDDSENYLAVTLKKRQRVEPSPFIPDQDSVPSPGSDSSQDTDPDLA